MDMENVPFPANLLYPQSLPSSLCCPLRLPHALTSQTKQHRLPRLLPPIYGNASPPGCIAGPCWRQDHQPRGGEGQPHEEKGHDDGGDGGRREGRRRGGRRRRGSGADRAGGSLFALDAHGHDTTLLPECVECVVVGLMRSE